MYGFLFLLLWRAIFKLKEEKAGWAAPGPRPRVKLEEVILKKMKKEMHKNKIRGRKSWVSGGWAAPGPHPSKPESGRVVKEDQ